MSYIKGLPAKQRNWSDLITDFSIDRVMVIDESRTIVVWNKAAELASGLDKSKVLGKQFFDLFPSLQNDIEINAAINESFQGRKAFVSSDMSIPHRKFYENHFIPLFDADKEVIGVMNIMHDVAHRIKVEEELRDLNNSLAEKYEQLKNLSHELSNFTSITTQNIREPLKYIYSSLELLISQEGRGMADGSKASLRRMQVSLNRINWLIDDIVELFGLNTVDRPKITLDPAEMINKAKQKLGRKISERSAEIIVGPLPLVTGNPEMITMLFQTLLDNALKFREEDAQPVIHISADKGIMDDHIHEAGEQRKEYTGITIKDNGMGIDEAAQKRIFRMFEQLNDKKKYPGTGLGLAFAEKIMQHHGGFIRVKSKPGDGAAFTCYFPVDHASN
jgi:PAS domain S-box-containing protein